MSEIVDKERSSCEHFVNAEWAPERPCSLERGATPAEA
jgi:uncharacterized protein YbdZ (MbtH family)